MLWSPVPTELTQINTTRHPIKLHVEKRRQQPSETPEKLSFKI